MFSKTKIALSAAMVPSTTFPASAATKHHRVIHVHPAARSDDIPTLDVNPVCHGIAIQGELEAGLQQTSFQQCVQSEQATREQLKKEWSTFTTADKSDCVALAKSGENPVTPNSSPIWKWRAMSESCTATLTACPSRTYHPRRWVTASQRHNSPQA